MQTPILKKWIRFDFIRNSDSGKTQIWDIRTIDNSTILAQVKWDAGWRKYSWFPYPDMKFEEQCTRDIADFIHELNELHTIKNMK